MIFHVFNFFLLGVDDGLGHLDEGGVFAVFYLNLCHIDGALVVGDHHEEKVFVWVAGHIMG